MQDRYQEIYQGHRWEVPACFNLGWACCGRHAADRYRGGLCWEEEGGATAAYTYWDIQQRANRLSNALAALGVARSASGCTRLVRSSAPALPAASRRNIWRAPTHRALELSARVGKPRVSCKPFVWRVRCA